MEMTDTDVQNNLERHRYHNQGNRILKGLMEETTGPAGLVLRSYLMFSYGML